MKPIKKYGLAALLALLLAFGLAACGNGPEQQSGENAFAVKIVCESKDIYQIFYSYYVNDEYCGMGGVADLDGRALTADSDLTILFPEQYFEKDQDISCFSMDFSPYGEQDTSEIATTAPLYWNAEYGKTYTVVFSGDKEHGFTVRLQE